LNASGDRRPSKRAKSTVVAADRTCGVPLVPFKVIELMVRSKPTTEANGASSPVTNTLAVCGFVVDVEVEEAELEDDPQLTPSRHNPSNNAIARNLFMANSGPKVLVLVSRRRRDCDSL
jgi:hypothetical protein